MTLEKTSLANAVLPKPVLDGATIFHVNVNCSDLERSLTFYRDGLGFTAGTRTQPDVPQPGTAFGLEQAMWDAWIMVGDRGFEGGAIDLLEWQAPTPIAQPPQSITETGWQRVGVMVCDIDAARANAIAHGGVAWSEPFDTDDEQSLQLCFVSDPDGVAIELIGGGVGPRVAFVGVTCADLERSVAWYESLGFKQLMRVEAARETGDHLRIAGPMAMTEVLMGAPGKGDVAILLGGFTTPAVTPMPPRPANALGAWRVAMLVDELDLVCARLGSIGIELMSQPVSMSMGAGLPELRFVCFRGPDHEVLELIERQRR